MMRGRFVTHRRQAGRKGQGQRQCRLGAGRRPRRHLRRQAAGGLRGRRGDMVAERLFRAAAGVDGEGGGGGPWSPCRRHGRRQRARSRHRGEARQPAQSELAQLRDQFRAGLFAQRAQRRALHRTRLRRAAVSRRAGQPSSRSCARWRSNFPTVASVRVREAMESVESLVAKLALAIRAATGVALTTSVLVLAGALAANRRARLADATILKILGATRATADHDVPDRIRASGACDRRVRRRGGDARRLSGRLAHHAVRFRLRLAGPLAAAGGGLAITVGLGMIGAWRILSQKPAAYLREL